MSPKARIVTSPLEPALRQSRRNIEEQTHKAHRDGEHRPGKGAIAHGHRDQGEGKGHPAGDQTLPTCAQESWPVPLRHLPDLDGGRAKAVERLLGQSRVEDGAGNLVSRIGGSRPCLPSRVAGECPVGGAVYGQTVAAPRPPPAEGNGRIPAGATPALDMVRFSNTPPGDRKDSTGVGGRVEKTTQLTT